ncbi:MAG TPA: HAD family phosphatase [Actinomycetes bacterium]|nr:HAD family phosphatase [Actinomycetes bacterium]
MVTASGRQPRGLIVDWGGVLTSSLEGSMLAWAAADDIDLAEFREAMAQWLGPPAAEEARWNPVAALERGELAVPQFEQQLAARLRTRSGRAVSPDGLIARMFTQFEHAPDMANVVRKVRRAGFRTALLSNSWGNEYPRDGWDELFDAVVISGEVGMRKPEERIYLHTVSRLELRPADVVFVDDLPVNVRGAVAAGLVGVRHESFEQTMPELEALFGLELR